MQGKCADSKRPPVLPRSTGPLPMRSCPRIFSTAQDTRSNVLSISSQCVPQRFRNPQTLVEAEAPNSPPMPRATCPEVAEGRGGAVAPEQAERVAALEQREKELLEQVEDLQAQLRASKPRRSDQHRRAKRGSHLPAGSPSFAELVQGALANTRCVTGRLRWCGVCQKFQEVWGVLQGVVGSAWGCSTAFGDVLQPSGP